MTKDSLMIATEKYYWKPAWSVFCSFQLEEYARAGINFEHPVMDLGCGDGTFAMMLQERGLLDSVDFAFDYSEEQLSSLKMSPRCSVFRADARTLPLKSGTLGTVIATGVLCCLETDIDRSISEVYRVLNHKGLFVLTLPTSHFNRNLAIPKFYSKIGASQLANQYLADLDRGLGHHHLLDEEKWLKKLKEAHFHVEQVRYFFTPCQGFWWDLLTLQIFRVFAISKILRLESVKQLAARIQEKFFRTVFEKEQLLGQRQKQDEAGYILVVARKKKSSGTS